MGVISRQAYSFLGDGDLLERVYHTKSRWFQGETNPQHSKDDYDALINCAHMALEQLPPEKRWKGAFFTTKRNKFSLRLEREFFVYPSKAKKTLCVARLDRVKLVEEGSSEYVYRCRKETTWGKYVVRSVAKKDYPFYHYLQERELRITELTNSLPQDCALPRCSFAIYNSDKHIVSLISHYYPQKDLFECMAQKSMPSPDQRIKLCERLLKGYAWLDKLGIIDPDTKPENIFVKSLETARLHIHDFGAATFRGKIDLRVFLRPIITLCYYPKEDQVRLNTLRDSFKKTFTEELDLVNYYIRSTYGKKANKQEILYINEDVEKNFLDFFAYDPEKCEKYKQLTINYGDALETVAWFARFATLGAVLSWKRSAYLLTDEESESLRRPILEWRELSKNKEKSFLSPSFIRSLKRSFGKKNGRLLMNFFHEVLHPQPLQRLKGKEAIERWSELIKTLQRA